MDWLRAWMMPPQGSEFAKEIDFVYMALFWLSVVLFLGIAIPSVYFAWRYRYKPGRVTPHQTHNTTLEILWSVVTADSVHRYLLLGPERLDEIFGRAGRSDGDFRSPPRQWLWQFEYPDGSRTINDIHVPVNKPVKFTMTSEDVLHDFFVPDMRVKHDIIPGRYTQIWFTPTVLGKHNFTCAEYCGKDHSDMQGTLTVDNDADFAKFWRPAARSGKTTLTEKIPEVAGRLGQAQVGTQGLQYLPHHRRHQEQGSELEGHLGQDGRAERRDHSAGGRGLRPGVDDEPAGQGGEGLRADHADVPGFIEAQSGQRTGRVHTVVEVGE